jgi:hypothetical protein
VDCCQRKGCTTEAAYRPVLLLAPQGAEPTDDAHLRVVLGLKLCPAHASTDVDDYLTDVGYAQICEALQRQGKVKPDRDSAAVELEPLQMDDPLFGA